MQNAALEYFQTVAGFFKAQNIWPNLRTALGRNKFIKMCFSNISHFTMLKGASGQNGWIYPGKNVNRY
jgi:hypothetical protein